MGHIYRLDMNTLQPQVQTKGSWERVEGRKACWSSMFCACRTASGAFCSWQLPCRIRRIAGRDFSGPRRLSGLSTEPRPHPERSTSVVCGRQSGLRRLLNRSMLPRSALQESTPAERKVKHRNGHQDMNFRSKWKGR